MEPLAELGRALAALRNLMGLSLAACAARVGTTIDGLVAMERGEIDFGLLEAIARLYALDHDELRQGRLIPVEGVEGATIFLLHGAYQDFDAGDLGVLERAMCHARAMSARLDTIDGGEVLRQRLQFVPAAPAGPRPIDAARQGYRLARLLRAKLELSGEPIRDMRALLEEQLGIAVVMDELISQNLRAASILDSHRAAAAAVLSAHHPDLKQNPVLVRVFLAHELCHLLWDPGTPGSVQLALDDQSVMGIGTTGLLESRAKGFAAEFLIPLEGVSGLLGPPMVSEASLVRARDIVARVREHFGTPWEIATYHLGNLGFIREELTLDLLRRKPAPLAQSHETSLPAVGAPPCLLERMLADQDLPSAEGKPEPPYVEEVRHAAKEAMDKLSSDAIHAALLAVERGREREAINLLVEHFDDLFHANEFEAASQALRMMDPERLPPKVLTGVLMVTAHAQDKLDDARVEFFKRVEAALANKWQLSPEVIDAIVRRLK